jgi:hypothetical protein
MVYGGTESFAYYRTVAVPRIKPRMVSLRYETRLETMISLAHTPRFTYSSCEHGVNAPLYRSSLERLIVDWIGPYPIGSEAQDENRGGRGAEVFEILLESYSCRRTSKWRNCGSQF